jgi:hypothetical protein
LAAIWIGGIATVIVTFALGRVLCLCLLRVPILRISLCTPPVWLGFRLGKTRIEAGPSLLRIRVSYDVTVAAGRNIPVLLSGPLGNLLAAGIIAAIPDSRPYGLGIAAVTAAHAVANLVPYRAQTRAISRTEWKVFSRHLPHCGSPVKAH